MKVSNLSEYGSLVNDPRILSRLNKGVVYLQQLAAHTQEKLPIDQQRIKLELSRLKSNLNSVNPSFDAQCDAALSCWLIRDSEMFFGSALTSRIREVSAFIGHVPTQMKEAQGLDADYGTFDSCLATRLEPVRDLLIELAPRVPQL